MTTNAKLIDEVRTLGLEVRKLELENRLTQLKAEQLIDDHCDVAKVWNELDKYKDAVRLERVEHVNMLRAVNQHHHTQLNKVNNTNIEDLYELFCIHEEELSVCSKDSEVLMRVVEIVERDDRCPTIINQLVDTLVDYLDTPEELDIDGHQDISITVALLERL
jgi:hypothetical protein